MIEVKYIDKLDIFHERFVGRFAIDDLIAYYKSVGHNNKLPRKLKIIVDYTKAEFIFDIDSQYKLAEVVRQNIKNYIYVKAAILHSKPYEQAVSMMFEELIKDIQNFRTEIFSTKQAALRWLLMYDINLISKKELIIK